MSRWNCSRAGLRGEGGHKNPVVVELRFWVEHPQKGDRAEKA